MKRGGREGRKERGEEEDQGEGWVGRMMGLWRGEEQGWKGKRVGRGGLPIDLATQPCPCPLQEAPDAHIQPSCGRIFLSPF